MRGHASKVFARPSELVLDLKQKRALSENVSLPEQQLVFEQSELRNENVLGRTGLREGSRVHLTLATPPLGHPQQTTYFTSCVKPSLSITHVQLGLGLEQLVGVASPRHRPLRVPLTPHIFHRVHVYDVPYHAWVALSYYLYSRQLSPWILDAYRLLSRSPSLSLSLPLSLSLSPSPPPPSLSP